MRTTASSTPTRWSAANGRNLKDAAAKEALRLLWEVGLALQEAYRLWLETQAAWRDWGVKKTARLLSQWILWSTMADEVLGCGGSP